MTVTAAPDALRYRTSILAASEADAADVLHALGVTTAGLSDAEVGRRRAEFEVTFLDMAGLGAIVGARSAQADRGQSLSVVEWSQQVGRMAVLASVEDLLSPPAAS